MATEALTVANTILAQLGGARFAAMTGAKGFVGDTNSLAFRLPSNFATKGINVVKVTLDPSDTYTVTFAKLRGVKYTVIAEANDVYNDNLRRVFTSYTGLDTSL